MVNEGARVNVACNGDHTSEICLFFGGDGGKEGGFFLPHNLLKGFAVKEGQVLLYGELWRGGHREI